jgi:ceramide glucosyltransferase
VNIIRPVKGLEPSLYDCLASTFRQTYPKDKLHVRFCVSDGNDPALPVLHRLINDFPSFDAKILIEDEDVALQNGQVQLGPNPKIRNMSRAYRESIGDFIWIIDCNVWVAKGVCGRLVAKLEGRGETRKNKFVHQLPLVIDTLGTTTREERSALQAPPKIHSYPREMINEQLLPSEVVDLKSFSFLPHTPSSTPLLTPS